MLSMKFSSFVKKQQNRKSYKICTIHVFKIATHCKFNSADREIKSHIIQFFFNNTWRLKAQQDPTLTLYLILTLSRTREKSKIHAAQIVSEKR